MGKIGASFMLSGWGCSAIRFGSGPKANILLWAHGAVETVRSSHLSMDGGVGAVGNDAPWAQQ